MNIGYTSVTAGAVRVVVYDIAGRRMYNATKNAIPGYNNFRLDLSTLQAGAYFLSMVEGGNPAIIQKLIITF